MLETKTSKNRTINLIIFRIETLKVSSKTETGTQTLLYYFVRKRNRNWNIKMLFLKDRNRSLNRIHFLEKILTLDLQRQIWANSNFCFRVTNQIPFRMNFKCECELFTFTLSVDVRKKKKNKTKRSILFDISKYPVNSSLRVFVVFHSNLHGIGVCTRKYVRYVPMKNGMHEKKIKINNFILSVTR